MDKESARGGTYIPNHELRETFADEVQLLAYDGTNFRIELAVSRESQSSEGVTRHPVARLVVPLRVLNELMNRTEGLLNELERRGIVQRERKAPPTLSS